MGTGPRIREAFLYSPNCWLCYHFFFDINTVFFYVQGVLSNEKMKAKEREAKPLDERTHLNPTLQGSLQTSCLLGTHKADRKALQRRHLALRA